jgi:hypothetical protein
MFCMTENDTFIVLIDFNDESNHETRIHDVYIYIYICSESWGMGAEGFRRAPMMQQKLTTLTTTELNPKPRRRRYIT